MANLLQNKTLTGIEAWFVSVFSSFPKHALYYFLAEEENTSKSWVLLHSPGVDEEIEKGIGLWPVRVEITIHTDKDNGDSLNDHQTALGLVNSALLRDDAAEGITALVSDFTVYDVTPTGADPQEVEGRKWTNVLTFTLLVMDRNIA